jgi:hypothetical protein
VYGTRTSLACVLGGWGAVGVGFLTFVRAQHFFIIVHANV